MNLCYLDEKGNNKWIYSKIDSPTPMQSIPDSLCFFRKWAIQVNQTRVKKNRVFCAYNCVKQFYRVKFKIKCEIEDVTSERKTA